jgi:hypothetical protein
MDFTMDDGAVKQRKERCSPRGPVKRGLLIHTQSAYAQDPRGLGQNGGQLFLEFDFSKGKFNAFIGIDFTIGRV